MAQPDVQRLIVEARQNEIKMRRFQAMELRLLAAESLPDLCRLLVAEYKVAFQLDLISLHLFDPQRELMRLERSREIMKLRSVYVHHSLDNRVEPLCGTRPRLCAYDPVAHGHLFPSTLEPIGSVCLLPLRRGPNNVGLFVLGSRDPTRFNGGDGTDFLQRLAAIAAICIENALNLERLRQAGLRDPLTDLYNRRHFDDSLRRELRVAQRKQGTLACLYIDIDHFKKVNDVHGHPVGDAVLQGVADVLRSQQRRSEILARLGGEEFALLMPATSLEAAWAAGDRIREKVARSYHDCGDVGLLQVSLSCGVAAVRPAPDDRLETLADRLLLDADNALLSAKRKGRNRVESIPSPAPRGAPINAIDASRDPDR